MAESLPADLTKVDPLAAWSPWKPTPATPWNRKWAAHLYRRAAFGATPAEVDRALSDGFDKTLERLLTGEADAAERWDLLAEVGEYFTEPTQVRGWWLRAMLDSGHPLREKLTLFWHNHFATSIAKIQDPRLMFRQNLLLRTHALGKFRPFLFDMSRDTAMLVWLDSNSNVKGRPNENYAREVMELFSLGVGHYTEKDVQEAARAFTGWHHDPEVKMFEFNSGLHDEGSKTVLGVTGKLDGADVVKICCDQPACARFLVGKLYAFLVSETPPPRELLAPLEERFRASDYDIADLVRTMLASRLFFSQHAYRKRVKWPVEYALTAVHAQVPGRLPPGDLAAPISKMGQTLFAPPNVKGWRTGTDWLNSATLLARNNFAESVAMGNWSGTTNAPLSTAASAPDEVESALDLINEEAAIAASEVKASLAALEKTSVLVTPAFSAVAGPALAYADGPEISSIDTPSTTSPKRTGADEAKANAPQSPPKSTPIPTPPADRDVTRVIFATKPANVKAVVKRMGEVLFGEEVAPNVRAKIETFLLDGKKTIASKDIEAPAFRHRVREAMHALMCLPEYQLD